MISRNARRRSGLSLVEVLVSMAIFLIALAAISQLMDMGRNSAYDASMINDGTRLAQSKLAEIEAGVIGIDDNESGEFELDPNWKWEVTSEQLASNTYSVTVRVYNEVYRRIEVSLTQVIFDPTYQSDGAPATDPNTGEPTLP